MSFLFLLHRIHYHGPADASDGAFSVAAALTALIEEICRQDRLKTRKE